MYPELTLLIESKRLSAAERPGEPVIDPATEMTLGEVPHATPADIDTALAAVGKGFADWSRRSPFERSGILRRAADILRAGHERYAADLTAEQGKPLEEATAEVLTSAHVLDWYAEEGRRVYGRIVPGRVAGVQHQVIREPVGPAAVFTPWNFPMFLVAHKLGAGLAAGCALILKPSEETPASALHLVEALHAAGVPADALQLVFGRPADVSARLIASPVIRKVSFTGSVAVGRHLMGLCAADLKRTTMELGGHAPVLVFEDADVEQVARMAAAAKFANAGQICISPTRFLVAEPCRARFTRALAAAVGGMPVGDGREPTSRIGPLANARRLAAIEELIEDALARGARLETGGRRLGNRGYFFAPTILSDVPWDARIMVEEPFGPVALVNGFVDIDDAIARANASTMGLAGYAFTASSAVSARLASELKVGMLGINSFDVSTVEAPFGGVKHSGHGHEGGSEALEAYLDIKHVVLAH